MQTSLCNCPCEHVVHRRYKRRGIPTRDFGVCSRRLSMFHVGRTSTCSVQCVRDKGQVALYHPCLRHGESRYGTVDSLQTKGASCSGSLKDRLFVLSHELLNERTLPVGAQRWPLKCPVTLSLAYHITDTRVVTEHLAPLCSYHAQSSRECLGVFLQVKPNPG